jgi:uncharacterized Ntn-hydrolase superfamily protein
MLELNTFSIAARCARTGMLGVAVATATPAVGSICAFAQAGVGAIATQSWTNPYLGIDGLALLGQGLGAQETLERLLAQDPGRHLRQVGIVDQDGQSAAWTGVECTPWYGQLTGADFSIQGNLLVGAATLDAMAAAFAANATSELPERLLAALEAGQAAGGDKRGKQSAALKVVYVEAFPYCDLRVDDHPDPVAELRRVFTVAHQGFLPFAVRELPSRAPLRPFTP